MYSLAFLYMYIINMGSEAFRSTSNLQSKDLGVQNTGRIPKRRYCIRATIRDKIMQLRHFALKGLSDTLLTSRGENKAFPPPSPSCNVVLSKENNKHPNLEWRRGGRGVDSLIVSVVTLFEYNVPTIMSWLQVIEVLLHPLHLLNC